MRRQKAETHQTNVRSDLWGSFYISTIRVKWTCILLMTIFIVWSWSYMKWDDFIQVSSLFRYCRPLYPTATYSIMENRVCSFLFRCEHFLCNYVVFIVPDTNYECLSSSKLGLCCQTKLILYFVHCTLFNRPSFYPSLSIAHGWLYMYISVEWKNKNVEFQKITITESCLMVGTRQPMKNF